MNILVDADSCPVKEIITTVAKARGIKVYMFTDTTHILEDGYSKIITVDKGSDSVDIALANRITKDDIAVTNDYGLASLLLGKGASVLTSNGLIYSNENIERLLFERHISRELRKTKKGRPKGFRPRSAEDNCNFKNSLIKLISEKGI